MKVLHVVSGLNPASGGPTRSVKGLCRSLSSSGTEVTLLVLRGSHPFGDPNGCKVVYGESPEVLDFDVVHIHGLWDVKLHKVILACRHARVPYVISPRGMLDPWALSVKRWKKILGMLLYQRRDLKGAAAFHVTAQEEADHVRAQGLNQPIFIAPNGVQVPPEMPAKANRFGEKTAIFLSRLHPGKGLLALADAWAKVKPDGWRMKVVGPDSYGHKKDVVAKLDQLGISADWQFVDMVDDVRKWQEYRAADLLIHPSVSENFGITIAEGLYAELPVICTKGTPWSVVEKKNCGWWIDLGVDALTTALKTATLCSDDTLRLMGDNGRKMIEESYLWPSIGRHVKASYEKLLKGELC